jgi:hypothetical protein
MPFVYEINDEHDVRNHGSVPIAFGVASMSSSPSTAPSTFTVSLRAYPHRGDHMDVVDFGSELVSNYEAWQCRYDGSSQPFQISVGFVG